MKKLTLLLLLLVSLLVAWTACGHKKTPEDYAPMLDSIRRAEAAKQLLPPKVSDPVDAWFDSLQLITLPIRYSVSFVEYLPQMTKVPAAFNSRFDYEPNIKLEAARLPSAAGGHRMVLLAEHVDSLTTTVYLCSMSPDYVLQDRLCLYEQKIEDRDGRLGLMRQEFFVTSNYEVTLVTFFRAEDDEDDTMEGTVRYTVNREGNFQEAVIEL